MTKTANTTKLKSFENEIFSAAGEAQHYQGKKPSIMRRILRLEIIYGYRILELYVAVFAPLFCGLSMHTLELQGNIFVLHNIQRKHELFRLTCF